MNRNGTSPIGEMKELAIARMLRRCQLFTDLPDSCLEAVASMTLVKSFDKGSYLFFENAPVHGFHIVKKGAIKLYRTNGAGKEQVIHLFRPYESFGEETLMSNSGHTVNACAPVPSEVLMVRKAPFVRLLRRQPELSLRIIHSLSHRYQLLLELVEDLTLRDVKTRLANWLIQRCPNPESQQPYSIELPITKRMLAAELGTVSETFSRTVASFREQKLLSVRGRTLTLLCPAKLVHLLHSEAAIGMTSVSGTTGRP